MRGLGKVLGLAVLSGVLAFAVVSSAQEEPAYIPAPLPGGEGERRELAAWQAVIEERHIAAREQADEILREDPGSFIGHIVAGVAQKYGEANFPQARYHFEQALRLMEQRHGEDPGQSGPWRWHQRLLRIAAVNYGDLEMYEEQLRFLARHNELYDPDLLAERSWPLMKLRRFDAARQAANDGLITGDSRQIAIGLNAICAVEFEAGLDGRSYEACLGALENARAEGNVSTVDLTNFAEAARSLFRLDEAERTLLEATRVNVSWYGNPWNDLAEIYTRQGRFPEALDALKKSGPYRLRRPPHVQNSDRNEGRRAVTAFFLSLGRAEDALRVAERARRLRDRRGHNSRDPAQDHAIAAVLERRARLLATERRLEETVGAPWYTRAWVKLGSLWSGFEAWLSGREATKLLGEEARSVGVFQVGTSRSAATPAWLVGDIVELLGPAVADGAIRIAREEDQRPGAEPYYFAFGAEAAWRRGDFTRAIELGEAALSELPEGEALLRARLLAVLADAAWEGDDFTSAMQRYDRAFQFDPGVLRRLGLALPVQIEAGDGGLVDDVVTQLRRSPRLDEADSGLSVRVDEENGLLRVCILGVDGAVLGCGEASREEDQSDEDWARAAVSAFHEQAFAPRIDMSQADANSLDGSNRTGSDAMDSLLEDEDTY